MNKTIVVILWSFLGAVIVGPSLAQDIKEVKETVRLSRDGRVSIENHKGSIRVTTWDRPEVRIHARIEPGGSSRREEEWVQDTEIRIDDSRNTVRIKTDYDRIRKGMWSWNSGSNPYVHYTIRMPHSAELDIEDHKSEIEIIGHSGNVRLNTHKGIVEIKEQDGAVDLETHKGEIYVEFASLRQDSRFETHKGDIEIVLHRNSSFVLDADLGDRANLSSDFEIKRQRPWSSRRWRDQDERFRTTVNGGGPRLSLQSNKGHFRLTRS